MNYPADFTDDLRKKPICGVLAVAVVAGVSFARATQAIKNNLMPWQKRHGGKTWDKQREGALRELGVNFRELETSRKNLHHWVLENNFKDVTFMVTTTSHVVTVRNGIVMDQYEISPIDSFTGRRCFVVNVLEIL